jgi:pimeloyl-ACP methyl ester carboxylesterase
MSHRRHPQFRWLERGEGEPVVLLHGLMGHNDHWDTTLDTLAPSARCLAPELPLFDPAFHDLSLAAFADYVRAFMDALGLRRAVVGGNSLGGHVALELALHRLRDAGQVLARERGDRAQRGGVGLRRRHRAFGPRPQRYDMVRGPPEGRSRLVGDRDGHSALVGGGLHDRGHVR